MRMKNRLLEESENVSPRNVAEARLLIGKRVEYLATKDIDKSGRGYFFPRIGTIEEAQGGNIMISGDWMWRANIVEMRIIDGLKSASPTNTKG